MADKLLLFLGAEWLSAHPWQQGKLQGERLFANDAPGHEAFGALLRQYPDTPCHVLTDLVEEDFRFESIPHVGGRDRADIVHRKFEQFYRSTLLRHAQVQYREPDGRRDDMMLFSALTNPELVTPWLDIMLEQEASVAGVYSVPLISHRLVSHIPSSHLLLLTWQKYSGLREIYYRDGNISFSRLTPLARTHDIMERLQTELSRTRKYLGSLSLLPANRPLDVCIICSNDDRQTLQAALENSDSVRYLFEDINEAAGRIGLKVDPREVPPDSDATPLLLHLLGSKPPANQYAKADDMHFHDLWKVRHLLRITAAAAAFGCLVWLGISAWQVFGLRQGAETAGVQKEAMVVQYRSIAATFPPFPVPVDRMKAAVSAVQKISVSADAPRQFLAGISRELAEFPMIQVNSLSWRAASGTGAAATGAGAGVTPDAAPSAAYQEIVLGGEILYSRNIRDTLDFIHQFSQALGKAGFVATPVTMPLDLGSKASIAGDLDGAGESKSRNTAFVMKVVWNSQASTQNPQAGTR